MFVKHIRRFFHYQKVLGGVRYRYFAFLYSIISAVFNYIYKSNEFPHSLQVKLAGNAV